MVIRCLSQIGLPRCMEAPECTFDPTVVFAAPPARRGEPIEHLFSTFTRDGKTIAAPDFVALFNIKHTGPARLDARSCGALMPDVLGGKEEMDIAETKTFAAQIKKLQDVFVAFDRDGSGAMSSYELGQALENSGFHLRWRVYERVWERFAGADRALDFTEFAVCVAALRRLFGTYEALPKAGGDHFPDINEWLLQHGDLEGDTGGERHPA
ncbi:calpain small subunit 1-like isoform X2 [Lethenteron reissneri]|uniref:calpain small subunit 1-like isoform X2 n=1 Tax=Lethenteron reissneri TaxID=7753 RepID=UPI002AB6A8C4|nr:calpain small subunit 1-like isoform X2 [Lethenteron reissneri]